MRIARAFVALFLVASLAGCLETDGERAFAGAAAGGVIASAMGGNVLAGLVLGAAGGAVCDNLHVRGCH